MIKIGSLLWIDKSNHSAVNNKNKKISSYFKQLDCLAKTLLKNSGINLYVFTNNAAEIRSWFKAVNHVCPDLIEITESYSVPPGTPFFGAHYKLEALTAGRRLLTSDSDRFILLDTDVISLRKFSRSQIEAIELSDLLLYDITDQLEPTYGVKSIDLSRDIEEISHQYFSSSIWYGGEFICASAKGLDRLILEAHKILPSYFVKIKELHHIGDEMFISAALNVICKNPGEIVVHDQAEVKIISRHWSRFSQPALNWHMQHSLLHCPGSKPILEILSAFKEPSRAPIGGFLKIYSWFVRTYQSLKRGGVMPS